MQNTPTVACEFCDELSGASDSRFQRIYGQDLLDRTVFESDSLVAWPTIGQLFPKSILILPRRHVERFADLGSVELDEFSSIAERVRAGCGTPGNYLLFEHGARAFSGTGCGIYHCHVHFVPVPDSLSVASLFPFAYHSHDSLLDAWSFHEKGNNYIVLRDTFGEIASIGQEVMSMHNIGSQYVRRKLVEIFGVQRPWDWREYESPEQDLLSAYRELRFADVS
ncbi:hypothetical protein M4951_05990 [Blastopirellula sp. J2-11]|uniref:HIT family protein n=1 Tax=Blastopirellula sp. J2-11 TaxID=2943192 RepID=UPI0021C5FAEB|nr:hypothetical protein [Blastopirellula sp. J2-11]UUO07861.1 hypothetical protein M4951_05990 [Blastopirellula sp. J2-11]